MVAAHRLELSLLEDPQQLDLGLQRQLADLVEEDRAASGQLEPAHASIDRPGEGTLDVTEELALHETRRDGAAVHLHERSMLPATLGVDRPRDQLLAGSGLAGDEYRRIGRRHLPDLVQHAQEGAAAADHLHEVVLPADLLLQIDVLGVEPLPERVDLREGSLQGLLGLHALELGPGPGGKDLDHRQAAGRILHRLVVQDGEQTDHPARGIHQGSPQITFRLQLDQNLVLGEESLQVAAIVASRSVQDRLAGRHGDVVLEVVTHGAPRPDRARPKPSLPFLRVLGHERVADPEGGGQMAN